VRPRKAELLNGSHFVQQRSRRNLAEGENLIRFPLLDLAD